MILLAHNSKITYPEKILKIKVNINNIVNLNQVQSLLIHGEDIQQIKRSKLFTTETLDNFRIKLILLGI